MLYNNGGLMKIQKDELHTILNKLKPVSLKDDLLVENFLGQLIFSEDGISIFNDQTYIFYPIETDLSCIVSYTKLLNFITKTSGKFVKIVSTDDKVKVICGKASLTLNSLLLNEIDSKTISEIKNSLIEGDFEEIPDGFLDGVEVCSLSTSKDPADGTLACVCVSGDKIMGTDRTRVGLYTMQDSMSTPRTILINSDLVSTLIKFNPIGIKLTDSWAIYNDDNECLLAMRIIRGKFPFNKFVKLFSNFESSEKIKLPDEVKRVLDLITSMVNETTYIDRYMYIQMEKDALTLSSTSESAVIKEKIKIAYKGTPFLISINPSALQEALKVIESPILEKDADNKKIMMQTDNFKHIIALKVVTE